MKIFNGSDWVECRVDLRTSVPIIEDELSDSMDRLHHEKHAKFRRWQDAITMNMIFGDNYVSVPEIPKGYEAYAKQWYDK